MEERARWRSGGELVKLLIFCIKFLERWTMAGNLSELEFFIKFIMSKLGGGDIPQSICLKSLRGATVNKFTRERT